MFLRTKLDGFYLLTSMCSIRLKQTAFFGVVVGYHGDAAAVETGVLFHDAARNGKQGIRMDRGGTARIPNYGFVTQALHLQVHA